MVAVVKHDPLTLEIPAEARYLTVVRLFAGSVGRQFGMSEVSIEDLMLAASDTCAWMMRWRSEHGSPRRVVISISGDGGNLMIVVESDRPGPAEIRPQVPAETRDVHLGLALIDAITDDLRVEDEGDATTVTFSISFEPRHPASDVAPPGDGHKSDD